MLVMVLMKYKYEFLEMIKNFLLFIFLARGSCAVPAL
jgi:hypothetical protein